MINILVVDHAAGLSRCVRNLISNNPISGFKIDFTTDYREILAGFRSQDYDVCLIDSAPGNGLRLFARARSLGCAAPVILVTRNDAAEALNAIRCGVADCLVRDDMDTASVERVICSVVEHERVTTQERERERRYLALVDNADELIFTHDLRGKLTSMNLAGQQLTGYTPAEWLTLRLSDVVGQEYRADVQQMIQLTLDARQQATGAVEILTKQGRSVAIEVHTHSIYQEGRVVEIQWIARDLSASRSPTGLNGHMQPRSSYQANFSPRNERTIFFA